MNRLTQWLTGIDWDPDWYVSQTEDENSWTVEAAIPLAAFNFDDAVKSVSTASGSDFDLSEPWSIKLSRRITTEDLWSDEAFPTGDRRSMWDLLDVSFGGKFFVLE